MAKTTFQTTQLDFDTIKNNLKTYFKRQSEFSDYDFEASGLSNILDVLAYNTHYNALFSNFALNEAYLSSAQLRSSVVSIAQTLGYNVRSRTASVANVQLSLNLSAAAVKPTAITLPTGFKFTASVDGVSYTFQTRSSYTATNDGSGIYNFVTSDGSTEIPIYEGTNRTKTFIVQEDNERQVYLIPDSTIDTSQAIVQVYDTFSSTSFTSYTNIIGATNITSESTFFKIYETPNGFYELTFGDGITTGQKPTVGNRVTIDYLSCVGPGANRAAAFSPVSQITVNGINYDVGVVVSSASHGGAFRQTIESIRQNAPLGFAAQQRLVTAEDYKTTILSKWRELYTQYVHPAGFYLGGEVLAEGVVNLGALIMPDALLDSAAGEIAVGGIEGEEAAITFDMTNDPLTVFISSPDSDTLYRTSTEKNIALYEFDSGGNVADQYSSIFELAQAGSFFYSDSDSSGVVRLSNTIERMSSTTFDSNQS